MKISFLTCFGGLTMCRKEREENWNEILDSKNRIYSRYVFSIDFKRIEEFAIVYVSQIQGKTVEILRYDCSKEEGVHVHKFYLKPTRKRYLNKEKNFDTIIELTNHIRENWGIYWIKFLEK
ncbi:MAG: hypothetical protein ABH821_03760 [archaeon]